MSMNLGFVFLLPAPEMYSNVNNNMILMTKLELHVYLKEWIIIVVDLINV